MHEWWHKTIKIARILKFRGRQIVLRRSGRSENTEYNCNRLTFQQNYQWFTCKLCDPSGKLQEVCIAVFWYLKWRLCLWISDSVFKTGWPSWNKRDEEKGRTAKERDSLTNLGSWNLLFFFSPRVGYYCSPYLQYYPDITVSSTIRCDRIIDESNDTERCIMWHAKYFHFTSDDYFFIMDCIIGECRIR